MRGGRTTRLGEKAATVKMILFRGGKVQGVGGMGYMCICVCTCVCECLDVIVCVFMCVC